MSRTKLIGSAAAVVSSVFLAGLFLAGPAAAFTGKSVSAANCDYGGKIKSIEATAEFNVRFTLCAPDPAFTAKAVLTSSSQFSTWCIAAVLITRSGSRAVKTARKVCRSETST